MNIYNFLKLRQYNAFEIKIIEHTNDKIVLNNNTYITNLLLNKRFHHIYFIDNNKNLSIYVENPRVYNIKDINIDFNTYKVYINKNIETITIKGSFVIILNNAETEFYKTIEY